MIRYGKLSDAQILKKVIEVCGLENVSYTDEGYEPVKHKSYFNIVEVDYYLLVIFFYLLF